MNNFFHRHFILIIQAVREDPQLISPAKPTASSRVSGAWKKVRFQKFKILLKTIFIGEYLEWR